MSGLPAPCGTAGSEHEPRSGSYNGAGGLQSTNNQPIPGMISGRVPTGGEQEMDSPAPCGEQQTGAGP